ncbi:MAG TPA: hypothetical protein V6C72_13935, partial [Chroococcales cyanobacterium]
MLDETLAHSVLETMAKLCQTLSQFYSAFLQVENFLAAVVLQRFREKIMQRDLFTLRPPEIFDDTADEVMFSFIEHACLQAI